MFHLICDIFYYCCHTSFLSFCRFVWSCNRLREKKRNLWEKPYTSKEAKNILTVSMGSAAGCNPHYLRDRRHDLPRTFLLPPSRGGEWMWVLTSLSLCLSITHVSERHHAFYFKRYMQWDQSLKSQVMSLRWTNSSSFILSVQPEMIP